MMKPWGGGRPPVSPTTTPNNLNLGSRPAGNQRANGLKVGHKCPPGEKTMKTTESKAHGPHPGLSGHDKAPRNGDVADRRPMSYASALASKVAAEDQLSYRQAADAAKSTQRILLVKGVIIQGSTGKAPDYQGWGNVIFEVLGFQPDDVSGVHFRSDGPLSSEVELAQEVEINKYAGMEKTHNNVVFKVSKIEEGEDVITFRDVPLSIPDCELIHIVKAYGGQMSKEEVHYKKETITTSGGIEVTLAKSSTRFIYATLPPNKPMRSFYWLHGLGPGDSARRIQVIAKNQDGRQCGSCLRTARDPFNHCRFAAKTSACKKYAPEDRMALADYLRLLQQTDNYVSLRNVCRWTDQQEDETDEVKEDQEDTMSDWAKEPTTFTPELELANSQAEINDLRTKYSNEKKYCDKAKKESARSRKEAKSLRVGNERNLPALREKVSETIRRGETEWNENLDFLSTLLASCVQLRALDEDEAAKGKLVPKQEEDPMAQVHNLLDNMDEQEQKRMEELRQLVDNKVLALLAKLSSNRTRSMSRSREESPDGEGQSRGAKSSRHTSPTGKESGQAQDANHSMIPVPQTHVDPYREVKDLVIAAARDAKEFSRLPVGGADGRQIPKAKVKSPGGSQVA